MTVTTEHFHNGNNSNTTFAYTFPYYKTSDIKVKVGGTLKTESTHYNVTGTNIVFTSGNVPPSGTGNVHIYRETDVDTSKATFAAGSSIRATDLNNNETQLLYHAQEQNFNKIQTADVEDGAITSDKILDGTIATVDIADNAVTAAKLATNSIDATNLAANSVGASEIADDAVDTAAIADDAVTSAKIATGAVIADSIGTNAVTTAKIYNEAVSTAKIDDGAVTTAKINNAAVTADKLGTDSVITAKILDANVTTNKIANDSVTTDKLENSINSSIAANTAKTTNATHTGEVTGATSLTITNSAVVADRIATNAVTTAKIANNAVTTAKIADAELTTLAGMQSGTASILADSTALTSTTAELNLLDGKSVVTAVSGSSTDVQLPTAKAVNDQIVNLLNEAGGFVPIANEVSFPNTNPDPNDGAGTIVSIADAGGVVVNGSGVSTTGRTLGGATVTINGIDSSLNSSTIAAGKGMLVQTTSTLNTYTYHRLVVDEAGVANAQSLVSDFNERYRTGSSNPTSSLDDGDLFFNTSSDKMLVYNATSSAWEEVQSVGNYFINTISSLGASGDTIPGGSATPNGVAKKFTLSNAGTYAEQHIVSVNGVIQKPNAGTSVPSEGFAIDGSSIIFSAAPATGSDFFIITIGASVNIGTPSNNTVTSAILQNGSVIEAKLADDAVTSDKLAANAVDSNALGTNVVTTTKIAADAIINSLIADTAVENANIADQAVTLAKLEHGTSSNNGKFLRANNGADPTFESVITDLVNDTSPQLGGNLDLNSNAINGTGTIGITGGISAQSFTTDGAGLILNAAIPTISFVDSDQNPDYLIKVQGGVFDIRDNTADVSRLSVSASGAAITGELAVTSDVHFNSATNAGKDVYWDESASELQFSDSTYATFGTGEDLQLYHDGSHSYIRDTGTGILYITASTLNVMNAAGNEYLAHFTENGTASLFYDNTTKIETTSTGITVIGSDTTGSVVQGDFRLKKADATQHIVYDASNARMNFADNVSATFGDGNDLKIYHDAAGGNYSYMMNYGAALLKLGSDQDIILGKTGNETFIHAKADGAVELYYDNAKVFYTEAYGAIVKRPSGGNTVFEVIGSEGQDAVINMFADDGDDNADKWRLRSDSAASNFLLENYAQGQWEKNIECQGDGNVELYYDNSKKLETTSNGISTGGHIDLVDTGQVRFGASQDLKIYHDSGGHSYIDNGTGNLNIRTVSGENSIMSIPNGAVELFYDSSKKFETYSSGVKVTGHLWTNYNGSSQYGITPNDSQTSGTHIQFQRQGYNNGNITHDTNNSAYNTSGSDRTLKKNFEDWTDSYWTAFKNLSPQKFHFLTDADSDPKCRGYIAQDLVATFPEAYPKEIISDKYMFNPSGMVPYLMKTLKEALTEIDTLKTKVAALEAK